MLLREVPALSHSPPLSQALIAALNIIASCDTILCHTNLKLPTWISAQPAAAFSQAMIAAMKVIVSAFALFCNIARNSRQAYSRCPPFPQALITALSVLVVVVVVVIAALSVHNSYYCIHHDNCLGVNRCPSSVHQGLRVRKVVVVVVVVVEGVVVRVV